MITDGISSPANIGGLSRLLDAFGITDLYCCNAEVNLNSSRLRRTARNTEKSVNIHLFEYVGEAVKAIRAKHDKIVLIGLEITTDSRPLHELELDASAHSVFVLGGEVNGISESVLADLDAVYHIPMYGNNSSMNAVQAAAICLYSAVQKLL